MGQLEEEVTTKGYTFIPIDFPEEEEATTKGYTFIPIEEEENNLKKIGRAVAQPFLGAAQFTPYGIATSLLEVLAQGEVAQGRDEISPDRINELKEKFPTAPWENMSENPQEKYDEAANTALKGVPTVSNLASIIESVTGLPLEAKSYLDKLLNLAGSGGKIGGKGLLPKLQGAAIAPASKAALDASGVPEGVSDVASLALAGGSPKISKIEKAVGPSGMPTRRFESLKKSRRVSERQFEKVESAIEKDFKKSVNSLIEKESDLPKTFRDTPRYREKLSDDFDKVEKLSKSIQGNELSRNKMVSKLKELMSDTEQMTSTADKRAYRNILNRKIKELNKNTESLSPTEVIKNFREVNKELGGYFTGSKSVSENQGVKDALLDFNKSIADGFKKEHPRSPLTRLFSQSNKSYSDLKAFDKVNGYLDDIFKEGVSFKKAEAFYNKPNVKSAFKQTLGEQGSKEFGEVLNELMSKKEAFSLMKQSKAQGFTNADALKWMVFTKLKTGKLLLGAPRIVGNELLSKPKFRTTWSSGIKDMKNKDFKSASDKFKKLDKMQEQSKTKK